MKKHVEFVIKSTVVNYYKVLGVTPVSTPVQIKAKYYELCKIHHPDYGGDGAEMAKITEAYAVLRDAAKRKNYEARRKLLNKPCATCKGEGVTYKTKSFTKREKVVCSACGGTGTQGGA